MMHIYIDEIEVDNASKTRGQKSHHKAKGSKSFDLSHHIYPEGFIIELNEEEDKLFEELLKKIIARYRQTIKNEL